MSDQRRIREWHKLRAEVVGTRGVEAIKLEGGRLSILRDRKTIGIFGPGRVPGCVLQDGRPVTVADAVAAAIGHAP